MSCIPSRFAVWMIEGIWKVFPSRIRLATAGVPTLVDTVWGCGYILREPPALIALPPP